MKVLGPLVASALAMIASPRAHGYPISPVTLWELVEEADTIVLARVDREEKYAAKEDDWNSMVAGLAVLETWKGTAQRRIKVPYPAGLICPAPPRYEFGFTLVAFLKRGEDKQFHTVGLSYGTLYPKPNDVAGLRELIAKAQTARATAHDKTRVPQQVDWLVQAASNPATRWHGLYELGAEADAQHRFYDQKDRPVFKLSAEHMVALEDAFTSTPVLDVTLPMMLRVLRDHPSAQITETAVAALDTILSSKALPHWASEVADLTLHRLKRKPIKTKPRGGGDLLLRDPLLGGLLFDSQGLRDSWTAMRKSLPYPRRTLAWPEASDVRGVGPETPP